MQCKPKTQVPNPHYGNKGKNKRRGVSKRQITKKRKKGVLNKEAIHTKDYQ